MLNLTLPLPHRLPSVAFVTSRQRCCFIDDIDCVFVELCVWGPIVTCAVSFVFACAAEVFGTVRWCSLLVAASWMVTPPTWILLNSSK